MIDYEELESYTVTLTIMVSDGMDWSDDTLTINILNVNEAPAFHQTKYTMEPPDEGPVGSL